jgi:hypothetical protein
MRLTTREQLSSSDARAAILSCHDELRGLVSETIHCADDATSSERAFEPLCVHARELYQAFEAHMEFEERILATALSDVIGWGSVLRSQVVEGHERQRAALASAKSALDTATLAPARVVESVRAVADELLHDLNSEERCLLTAELDAMATDTPGG